MQTYKDEVDKFYLYERKNIYQKFAFQAGGDLQEIIFSREKTEERIFLLRCAETLLNIPIDEITDFVKEKNLDAISAEVLTQFAQLKRRNFTAYLADSKAYSESIKKARKRFQRANFQNEKIFVQKMRSN